MTKNPRMRRVLALGLAVVGLLLLLLAPGNAWLGVALIAAGLVLELIGINLRHRDH